MLLCQSSAATIFPSGPIRIDVEAFSSSTPRESSRSSHRDFVKLLNDYEKFAHAADEYRLGGKPDPAVLASLLSQHDQVRHLAGKVTEDLKDEPD